MVRRDNPLKPIHKNGQSWTLYPLTGNPEYVDDELVVSLSAIVSRMEQRLSSFVGTIEICGVSRIRMANLFMKLSHGTTGKKKSQKQSAKATLAEVMKEMAKPRVAMSARE
jgi:hypothetical protein